MYYSQLGFQVPEQQDIYNIDHVAVNMDVLESIFSAENIEGAFKSVYGSEVD
jgi:hypothetical protein